MMKIIGTSHISKESIQNVKKELETGKYDVVAVELDTHRLSGLENQEKSRVSINNPMAYAMSKIQNYLSKKTGITPGTEMVTAVHAAEENGAKVALIDQEITTTVKKIKEIPLKEKIKMSGYVLTGFLGLGSISFDLEKVPDEDFVEDLLKRFQVIFPETYRVLIGERNLLMARKIRYLDQEFENVLAVVGAGHKPGIKKLLENQD